MKTYGYECIAAWDRMMHSGVYYTEQKIEQAQKDAAPIDAIYEKLGPGGVHSGDWARLKDVTSVETQWYFKNNHPDLVAKYTDWEVKQ
jgi:hypothetical protein